eukprot:UN12550
MRSRKFSQISSFTGGSLFFFFPFFTHQSGKNNST